MSTDDDLRRRMARALTPRRRPTTPMEIATEELDRYLASLPPEEQRARQERLREVARSMNHNDPFNNDFFKQHSKMMTRTTSAFLGIWLVWVLVCLAGAAGLGYVAWHFISKFW